MIPRPIAKPFRGSALLDVVDSSAASGRSKWMHRRDGWMARALRHGFGAD